MKPVEAYEIICAKYRARPFVKLCKDFGDAYGFFLTENENDEFVGSSMLCVNKDSGRIFEFNLSDKMYNYRDGIDVPFNNR